MHCVDLAFVRKISAGNVTRLSYLTAATSRKENICLELNTMVSVAPVHAASCIETKFSYQYNDKGKADLK